MIRVSLAIALVALTLGGDLHAEAARVEVRGSELVISTGERVYARSELVGAVLAAVQEDGSLADVRIDRIVTDPRRAEGDVVLYDLSIAEDDGIWVPACPVEADGAAHAVLQSGQRGAIEIFCTSGARGKCIRLGYRPWAMHDGVELAAYWQACVKMIRADYCGDDRPTTRDGMLIDIYDTLGINPRGGGLEFAFEAAWDSRGALCVAHPRVPQNMTLDALAIACPRLADHLGASCTEHSARGLGRPLLFNASRGDGIPSPAHESK